MLGIRRILNFIFSDAVPYLPARTEPVNVKVGIEEKTSVRLDLFGSIRLGKAAFFSIIC